MSKICFVSALNPLFHGTGVSRVSCRILISLLLVCMQPAYGAGPDADVIKVSAVDHGAAGWSFQVTVSHPDTGWDDYCNGWNVVADNGTVLKAASSDEFTRLLLHPHENEQPFTRGQGGLQLPADTRTLTVRAHDLVDGFGGQEIVIDLATDSGPGYTVERR